MKKYNKPTFEYNEFNIVSVITDSAIPANTYSIDADGTEYLGQGKIVDWNSFVSNW